VTLRLPSLFSLSHAPSGAPARGNPSLTVGSGIVLEKVVEYFHYWYRYRDKEDVPDMPIPVELCLELLVAADFLGLDSEFLPWPARVPAPSSSCHEPVADKACRANNVDLRPDRYET